MSSRHDHESLSIAAHDSFAEEGETNLYSVPDYYLATENWEEEFSGSPTAYLPDPYHAPENLSHTQQKPAGKASIEDQSLFDNSREITSQTDSLSPSKNYAPEIETNDEQSLADHEDSWVEFDAERAERETELDDISNFLDDEFDEITEDYDVTENDFSLDAVADQDLLFFETDEDYSEEIHVYGGVPFEGVKTDEDRAIDMAMELFREFDISNHEMNLLASLLEQSAWGQTKIAIRDGLVAGLSPEQIVLASDLKNLWDQKTEFKIAFFAKSNNQDFSSRIGRKVLSWRKAFLIICSFGGCPCFDEVLLFLDNTYDDWFHSPPLRKKFKNFHDFLLHVCSYSHTLTLFIPNYCNVLEREDIIPHSQYVKTDSRLHNFIRQNRIDTYKNKWE